MAMNPEKPIETLMGVNTATRPQPGQVIGSGGTAVYGGYIQEYERDPRLVGRSKYRTYSDILANVSVVAAGTRFFLNMVGKATWKVEAADDSEEAQRIADLVYEMMHDMKTPWQRIIRRAAMYRFYGFSIQEWVAKKREDGAIGMADIAPRPQVTIERWNLSQSSEVLGVVQRNPQDHVEIYIPREKLIYVVDDSLNDSPEGLGLFRHIVDSAMRLQRLEQLEGFGFETDLRGIPVGRGPFTKLQEMVSNGTLTAADKAALEEPLKRFMRAHIRNPQLGMLLDSQPWTTIDEKEAPSQTYQWDLTLLKGDGSGLEEIAMAVTRIQNEIARVLGVEHLLIGSDGAGSLALSKDKSTNFGLIVDSTLQEIAATMSRDWLRVIFELNGWDRKLMPEFKTETTTYRDIEQLGKVIGDLATAGVILTRDDETVRELFDLMGLSRPADTDLMDPGMQLASGTPPEAESEDSETEEPVSEEDED